MGTLYLVSTPIGNLEDISARAARLLAEVDAILAEDTRRTAGLLRHLGATTPLISLHAHNEAARTDEVLSRLGAGEDLALVSDAGTPLVSDPGERVVRRILDEGHQVVPIPGPSAVLHALVGSGLPATPFTFLGFVPRKGSERTQFLERIASATETLVLFESPERVGRLLQELVERCGGDRQAAVARELTKLHEEFRRGSLEVLAAAYEDESPRGEISVVVGPATDAGVPGEVDEEAVRVLARASLAEGVSRSRTARELARRLGVPRNTVYQIVQELPGPDHDSEGSNSDE